MKKMLTASVFLLLFLSCSKSENPPKWVDNAPLNGKWVMLLYIDSTTNKKITKDSSGSMHMFGNPYDTIVTDNIIDISFIDSIKNTRIINGRTSKNGFWLNCTTGANKTLEMGNMTITMIEDRPWGDFCMNVIANANAYDFDDSARLLIKAPTKTLVFKRE